MSLYERFAATARGARALAAARLRQEVLGALHQAQKLSGLSQSEIAQTLGVRRSAANQVFRGDGNLRVNTMADYLHAMGFELDIRLVRAGEPRRAALERREVKPVLPDWRVQPSPPTSTGVPIDGEIRQPPVPPAPLRTANQQEYGLAAFSASTSSPIVGIQIVGR
ncbi:hypothetical protein Nocox_07105 [Nonomuraea coxensis DSM 45129]|uniref:HTH cro/C1-type domain-containing protein n=1 Tax=Nonomuraea coxensis DSM 45129 TaxID=1122611 RepID=A0ABX8TUL5_9ACTN|nr:helix-turn-helix transcriptional regulator [Nonomuraea coxensis]QYC39047.1 hypothetical protein Nocox_07105 [Nonomuraea coxensis DSM 45129]